MTDTFKEPLTVAFFGISGSGKGTQADLLIRFLSDKDPARGIARAEMGKLIRTFTQTDLPLAKKVNEIITAGGLLPSFIPIYLLVDELNREGFKGTEHLILDGTCRKPLQSKIADEIARFYGRTNVQAIVLTLSKESARNRLIARGRADDATEEALARRFAWYEADVVPSIASLKECGWTIHEIDGEGDIQTIHQQILSRLGLVS